MADIVPLESLGPRIVIMGPSTAGKSTLAQAIGHKLQLPVVYLDQLHHTPNTDWHPRPAEEFLRLQRAAIDKDEWIIEGNYSGLLPERLARATGAIVLDGNRWMRLVRYCRRTLFERRRAGKLEGSTERLKWSMIHWVLFGSRFNGTRYRDQIRQTNLPFVFCHNMAELRALHAQWALPDADKTIP